MGAPPVQATAQSESVVHRLPAHVKVAALLGFVVAVVAAPRDLIWSYAAHLALVIGVAVAARIRWPRLLRGLTVLTPFAVGALLLPIVVPGPTTSVAGVNLSVPGLWAAWALLAKAGLGVLAATLFAETTERAGLPDGLRRLGLPAQLADIMGMMIRYVDVVGDQWGRMRVARASRGFQARTAADWPPLARSLGVLFIRSYERGERVHLAMLSRGYTGRMPTDDAGAASASTWITALAVPAAAVAITAAAWWWGA